jgi:hypothetical protein
VKRQDPSTKEIPAPNLKNLDPGGGLDLEVWSFSGCWILVLGTFMFGAYATM